MEQLNIFYEEPDNDRWIKYDRYPRKIIRKLLRKKAPIGGVKKWFLNLIQGLDLIGYPYKINDFKSLTKNPNTIALVIGKPQVIEKIPNSVKIVYGPAVASHPSDNTFWESKNIIHILFSCKWLHDMYQRDLPISIPQSIWPSGIETEIWKPVSKTNLTKKFLLYDKVRWDYASYKEFLIDPIKEHITKEGIEIIHFRYGSYKEEDFKEILKTVDGMIFLCEHETQGFAYLQALSSNVPILAWDRGGFWQDPSYYPNLVQFKPVTSVPYWDERCGEKFATIEDFRPNFIKFNQKIKDQIYEPRNYILENLTLEICAQKYVDIYKSLVIMMVLMFHLID